MALITYDNKVAINENPSIPDINKVNASDMNQIKTGVNTNETNITTLQTTLTDATTYSTTETVVGTWLGKPLYRKVYSTILTGGTANIPISLTNISIKKMESLISYSDKNNAFPGNVYRGDPTTNQSCYITGGNIIFSTQYDRTGYELNVVLEYTKTTD